MTECESYIAYWLNIEGAAFLIAQRKIPQEILGDLNTIDLKKAVFRENISEVQDLRKSIIRGLFPQNVLERLRIVIGVRKAILDFVEGYKSIVENGFYDLV